MTHEQHRKIFKANAFPDNVPEDVKEAMEHFYFHSNASSAHNDHESDEEHFASLFTPDGVYNFFGNEAKGHNAIVKLRHSIFEDIPHRNQWIEKVYTRKGDHLELMVLGGVEYKHHSGVEHMKQWAGQYTLTRDGDGKLKLKYVGIIGDPSQPEGAYRREESQKESHRLEADKAKGLEAKMHGN